MAKPPYIQVYLSKEEKAAFQRQAAQMGMKESAFGRFLFLKEMARVRALSRADAVRGGKDGGNQ